MAVQVKICGIKSEAALAAALEGGADYVGFVFYPPSPRSLSPEAAAPLAAIARGRAKVVALLVDPDDALLDEVVGVVDPDLIQLHGNESPGRVADIRGRWGRPVVKAISVETPADAERALDFHSADMFLFDAKPPRGMAGALPGGNGIAFDWHVLEGVAGKVRFMLSGGLNPDNVAAAIRLIAPEVVDVSSGVETRPGEKDPRLIRLFLAAAKAEGPGKRAVEMEARSE